MKPVSILLAASHAKRVSPELAASIVGIGNAALLGEPLLGLIASRECPGQILIDTIDRLPLCDCFVVHDLSDHFRLAP